MTEEIYRTLQQRLDRYSLGFPATESGIELAILKRLFSKDDAALFLQMSPKLEDAATVASRLGRTADEIAKQLADMADRGLLFTLRKGDSTRYGAIPFMHGLVEFQVARFDRELGEMLERYFEEAFHDAIGKSARHFMRTIPVNATIVPKQRVAAFEDVREILAKADTIAVAECLCRKEKRIMGGGCGKPIETCFMFGSMARYYIDHGLGRQVDAGEALKIVRAAQDAGLITQPSTSQNPAGMCNCCGDCCAVLMAVKKFPRPAEMVFSNYRATINAGDCTGCEACSDRCQMEALSIGTDGIASVDSDRCIGCGLCIGTCPSGALALEEKPESERHAPPENNAEQMLAMARARGVI